MDQKNTSKTLRAKLLEVGKEFTTFAVTEASDKKKPGTKESSYKFTPGYEIVEKIRAALDKAEIKLEPNCKSETHEMVRYPVYKLVNGNPFRFDVEQMYVTVTVEYRFIDTVTGEEVGPFTQIAAGANGIDKSISSALSLAERYFLLKYFQITTREPDAEPDMHDADNIPGLGTDQPVTARVENAINAQPVASVSRQQPSMPAAPLPQQQPAMQPQVTPQQYQMTQQMLGVQAGQNKANETYAKAVEELMYFEQGTESHTKTLNHWLTQLRLAGFDTSVPEFAQTLTLTAQSRRMGQTM